MKSEYIPVRHESKHHAEFVISKPKNLLVMQQVSTEHPRTKKYKWVQYKDHKYEVPIT
jgi:hypothetical protein